MQFPSSVSTKPLKWIKKVEIASLHHNSLGLMLMDRPTYTCVVTAWYCCVHPGGCFLLHSFVVHCACVRKSECVCLGVCKFGGGHSCIVEPFSASFLSGSFDTRLAHTWARPLPIHQPTPRQHTHLRTATGTVSNTQMLVLIGQNLVAAKNVLSESGALVFADLTLVLFLFFYSTYWSRWMLLSKHIFDHFLLICISW